LTTAVTSASPVGQYPIGVAIGTLAAQNYTFTFAGGVYTMNPYKVPDATVKLSATGLIARGASYTVTVTVANTGTASAQSVILTTLKLNSVTGAAIPASLGDIPAGGSASVRITVPVSAGASGTSAIEQILGTYTGGGTSTAGGTFGGTFRVVLP
jgi:hypothetical protein